MERVDTHRAATGRGHMERATGKGYGCRAYCPPPRSGNGPRRLRWQRMGGWRWTNRVAWTGAESSGGGPLLDGVSTFLGDGGLGQRDLEPLGSRGLWFLCSSVLPSGSGAGVMAGVWRGVLCTHAVMVARRTFHGGGSVGALAVDGRRSRGRGPVWCAPRGTRRASYPFYARTGIGVRARSAQGPA